MSRDLPMEGLAGPHGSEPKGVPSPHILPHIRPRFLPNSTGKGKMDTNKKANKLKERKLKKPWMTDEICSEIQKQNKLYGKATNSKDAKDWEEFKNVRNKVTHMIHDARKEYFQTHKKDKNEQVAQKTADKSTVEKESVQESQISTEITLNRSITLMCGPKITPHPPSKRGSKMNKHGVPPDPLIFGFRYVRSVPPIFHIRTKGLIGSHGPMINPSSKYVLPPCITHLPHLKLKFLRNHISKGKMNTKKNIKKLKKLKLKEPWMTYKIYSLIQKKNILYAIAKKERKAKEWRNYKYIQKKLTRMISYSKKKHSLKNPKQVAPNIPYCDVCDRNFGTEKKLEKHIQEHQMCNIDGCTFAAHQTVIQMHIHMHHRSGLYQRLKNVMSEEDIDKWRAERKRRYPTVANVKLQKAEQLEKKKHKDREANGNKNEMFHIIYSKETLQKIDTVASSIPYCDACDRDFGTEKKLENHIQEHQMCNIDGCTFSAHQKVVQKHIRMHHRSGLHQRMKNIISEEDIDNWRAERKRRYPTAANVKLQETEQMKKKKHEDGKAIRSQNKKPHTVLKKAILVKITTVTPSIPYCDFCHRGFYTKEKFDKHIQERQMCNIDGCTFAAHQKVVQNHIRMHHRSGLYQRLKNVMSEEDIDNWRAERKRRYPTEANVKLQKAELLEKKKHKDREANGNKNEMFHITYNKEKLQKIDTVASSISYCDVCNRNFGTKETLENHIREHQMCNIDGCTFAARQKVIQNHIRMHHRSGLYERLKNVINEEDIDKWKAERKRRYPTKSSVKLQEAE